MRHKYYVTTYDPDTQRYTPQAGVRTGPYSQFGLRKAIRKLRDGGYEARITRCNGQSGDPSVLIERDDCR
jgi:hypothetical protein